MAIVVEDGTGLVNAESFVSIADADTYHANRGNTTWTGDDTTVKEPALRRASTFLGDSWDWQGYKVNGRSQSLSWPRTDVTDGEGIGVASDSVPQEIVDACCEAALQELTSPASLTPVVTASRIVKKSQVGPLSKEFFAGSLAAEASRPVMLAVRDLVGDLLNSGGASPLSGAVYRG